MEEIKVIEQGKYKGYRWAVERIEYPDCKIKFWCGYVETHGSAKKNRHQASLLYEKLKVRGGTPYLSDTNPLSGFLSDKWWLNFSCCYHGARDRFFTVSRDMQDVGIQACCIEECKKLIDQLIELESRIKHPNLHN